MRVERIVESTTYTLSLSETEAAALRRAGTRLASDKSWWGSVLPPSGRTVIQCDPRGGTDWSVRVQDAVGLVSLGDLQIVVEPKIPASHLLFLFSQSEQLPRLDDQAASAGAESGLWELVARWFVRAALGVLRRDLIRDYSDAQDHLPVVRGQIEALPTARAFYAGRLDIHCQFEEFTADTPLNRIVKAAARVVRRSAFLSTEVRRDGARILARLADVGDLRSTDVLSTTDRRTSHYADCVSLARHILRSIGRSLDAGGHTAWTFLIRTPELVEAGVRTLLARSLGGQKVQKVGRQLSGSAMTVNPDLVFSPGAVGDVKYKRWNGQWNRADLYEVVAFSAAFKVVDAVVIDFDDDIAGGTPVNFGAIAVQRFAWPCSVVEPIDAAARLVGAVGEWLNAIPSGAVQSG